jgi:mono/diheme cytochrome c family protein
MKKIVKILWITLAGLLVLFAVFFLIAMALGNDHLQRIYTVQAEAIRIPTDVQSIAHGKHIASTVCAFCHNDDLSGGKAIFDIPIFGRILVPNLTAGKGGVADRLTDAHWVLAIRHGLDENSQPLVIMPSSAFYFFSDEDLGDVIAWVKNSPAVDKEVADTQFTLVGKAMFGIGAFTKMLSAEQIDQSGPRPIAPQPSLTIAYGEYLVNTHACRSCHGADLKGGANPDPKGPVVPNITPSSDLAKWSEADFSAALRTGQLPNNHKLSDAMPWKQIGRLTDDEIQAVWLFLTSLP